MKSNCWAFAISKVIAEGGGLIVRRSEYGWWPHVQWVDKRKRVWEFMPTEPKRSVLKAWKGCVPLIYEGRGVIVGGLFYKLQR